MNENNWPDWADTMVSLAAIDKLIGENKGLPDDELGSETELIEALIAYQDAQELVAAAAERYRDAQKNWSRVRLPILKARQEEIESAKTTAETVNQQPGEPQTGDALAGQGPTDTNSKV